MLQIGCENMPATEDLLKSLEEIRQKKRGLEKNSDYQKSLGDEKDTVTRLNITVREEFVEKWKKVFKEKYDCLVELVGLSPEPIIRAILSLEPKKVVFIATPDAETQIDIIAKEANLIPSQIEKKIVEGEKPEKIYDVIREYAKHSRRIAVDISGGKKSMSASAAIAASFLNLDVIYNDYKDYDEKLRIPVPGSEYLAKLSNPFETYQDFMARIACELFNSYDYQKAEEIFKKIADETVDVHRSAVFKSLSELSKAYLYFDTFQFNSAMRSLDSFLKNVEKFKWRLGINLEQLKRQAKALSSLSTVQRIPYIDVLKDAEKVKLLVFTTYNSALRKAKEERYEDGVVRLYRTCEIIAQHRLALRDIDTDDAATNVFNDEQMGEYKTISFELYTQSGVKVNKEDIILPVKSSLMNDFVMLKVLKDELTENFQVVDLYNAVEARNKAYIEHGIQIVSERAFKRLGGLCEHIIRKFCDLNGFNFDENRHFEAIKLDKTYI